MPNVGDAHVLAAQNLLTTKTAAGEAFFISNMEPITFRDFCLAVWREFGHIPPYEIHIPESLAWAAGYVAEWVTWLRKRPTTFSRGGVLDACAVRYTDGVKSRKILGYVPRIGIEEGIRLSCQVSISMSQVVSIDTNKTHTRIWLSGSRSLSPSERRSLQIESQCDIGSS